MTEKKYQLLFYGEIKPGADVESVKNNLAQVFRQDKGKIEALFSGEKKIVKKDATRELCEKTKKVFDAAGAVASIVPQGSKEPPEPPPPDLEPEVEGESVPARLPAETLSPETDTVSEKVPVDKVTLLLLTFFLGGFGAHKFYLARNIQGFLYFLFCWTLIPGLLALVEFFLYLFTAEEKIKGKYNAGSTPLVIIMAVCGPFFFMIVAAIITAILIPLLVVSHQDNTISSIADIMPRFPVLTKPAFAASFDHDTATCSGKIKGVDFSVQQALLENGVLYLRQGNNFPADREMMIFMFGKNSDFSHQRIETSADKEKFSDPQIHLKWKTGNDSTLQSEVTLKGYDLILEFGQNNGYAIQGRIDLNIPGQQETCLTGTFRARLANS